MTARRQLLMAIVATVSTVGTGGSAVASPRAAALAPLSALVVAHGDVGANVREGVIADGTSLKPDTLAFCGRTLHSDSDRIARLQVYFEGPAGPRHIVDEEIARYRAGDGAAARRDLALAAHLCPRPVTYRVPGGGSNVESDTPTRLAGTPRGATVFTETVITAQHTTKLTAIFITRGDLLVGVYGGTGPDAATAVRVARLAAAKLARA